MSTISIRVMHADGSEEREVENASLPCTLGRDPASGVRLSHNSCSTRHAVIQEQDGEIVIIDQNSRNGIFDESGSRVTSFRISGATRVRLGQCWLEITPDYGAERTVAMSFTATAMSFPKAAVIIENAAAEPPARRGNAGADWVDRALGWSGNIRFSVFAFAGSLLAIFYYHGFESFRSASHGVGVLGAALLSSVVTYVLARLFRGRPDFRGTFFTYVTFFSVCSASDGLAKEIARMHPEGSLIAATLPAFAFALFSFVFVLNLRLIWSTRVKFVNVVAVGLAILTVFGAVRYGSKVEPAWQKLTYYPHLDTEVVAAPRDVYVPSSQFIAEMGESLRTLRAPAHGDSAKEGR